MKKTILILSIITLFFAGCTKDDVFHEGDVFVYGVPDIVPNEPELPEEPNEPELPEEPGEPELPEEPGESGGFITTKCVLLENYGGVDATTAQRLMK